MLQLQTPQEAAQWLRLHVRGSLCTDSRRLAPGDGFIAWPGARADARALVRQALQDGAAACLVEHDGVDAYAFDDPRVASMQGLQAASARVADAYCDHPSHDLSVLAVTGTNGKTSTAWWLAQALSGTRLSSPRRCAMVGTLGAGFPPEPGDEPALDGLLATGLTTPDGVLLQTSLRGFADAGAQACAIEASSIGIESHRLDGVRVHTAIFTNLTQDHLDHHGDMASYWRAKQSLFQWPGLRAAVVNIDDPKGRSLAETLSSQALDLWTVSREVPARLRASALQDTATGMRFTVAEGAQQHLLETRLIGHYNVSNLLGVLGTLRSLGVPLAQAVAACSDLMPVPGRLQCVQFDGQPLGVVDYAHTPDALDKALAALRPLARQRGGDLWCVFGCGGDRDPAKRWPMGAAAAAGADRVVLTSDNPRSENPHTILQQIAPGLAGHTHVAQIEDRGRAIAHALQAARSNDVVLVAGKGHEAYQETAGTRAPFSDLAEVRKGLALRMAGSSAAAPGDASGAMMTLAQARQWIPGAVAVGDTGVQILRVHTDTRSLQSGDLFVALKGERFDANQFLAQAKASGAVAAICLPGSGLGAAGLPGLEVADTKAALGQLAAGWRAQFALPLIAVTGSNGKTTVTQMLASILRAWKGNASLATQGNLNNDIGVPLTLLRLRPGHRVAVLELGMNHPGEIAYLASLARPTVALVNNAQREHLEFMATVEAVARENGAVITALPQDGVAVMPHDDAFSGLWRALAGTRRPWSFALAAADDAGSADVRATAVHWSGHAWKVQADTPAGVLHFTLHIAGLHNVRNALAAATCALAVGVPARSITRGLDAFVPVKGRSRALELSLGPSAVTLIDDSYNANPDSVTAALELLATLPAPRLMVLGDMGEVGHQGEMFHAQAGALAHQLGIERLLTHGPLSAAAAQQAAGARHFDDMSALIAAVLDALPGSASVLVKGSRFMRMERVVEAITRHAQDHQDHTHAA